MNVLRVAAFSRNGQGGNPAAVVIGDKMPGETEMLQTAKAVGYSETAFLAPQNDGWRVRYFAPEMEVAFCGHATIASGAVLGERYGENTYALFLNQGEISVSASRSGDGGFAATLQSPATWSASAPQEYVEDLLVHFNFSASDLDPEYPLRFAFAGAKHLILPLKAHATLSEMAYDFEPVKGLMQREGLTTLNLIWVESGRIIHSRNPFPPGGVYEDPATGAAAAALAGYLRDIRWPGGRNIEILQGQEMGAPSRLLVQFSDREGESVRVSGETRHIRV
jgi:PhzF family phenazine biosynthesis protein